MISKKLTGLAVIAGLFFAGTASAQGILGTEHDFSQAGAFNDGGEICVACHTTHNTDTTVSDAPLWNHEVTTATFTPYDSGTMNAATGAPDGISLLCLSCHDGTVALDSFGGATGSQLMTGGALVGTDLQDDHPVGITYDTALAGADGALHDPSAVASGLGGNINVDMLFGPSNDKLECGSCHDVHDDTFGAFLVKSNASSALCLTCHDK